MISSLWLSRSSLRVTLSNLLGLLASLLSGSSRLSAKQHLCPTLTYQRSVESQQYALNERRVWSWSGPAYTVARGVPYRPRRLVSSPPGRSVSRPRRPPPRSVWSSTSTSSRRTSSSTSSSSSTTSLRTLISSLTTGRFSTTTSSSVTGIVTSSSPISASEASRPSTGTRSTLTSSCLVGTEICSRSVRTRLRTLRAPASRSRVPALSSSSVLCTLSSSSSSRSLVPDWFTPSSSSEWPRNSPVSVSPSLMPGPTWPGSSP